MFKILYVLLKDPCNLALKEINLSQASTLVTGRTNSNVNWGLPDYLIPDNYNELGRSIWKYLKLLLVCGYFDFVKISNKIIAIN